MLIRGYKYIKYRINSPTELLMDDGTRDLHKGTELLKLQTRYC